MTTLSALEIPISDKNYYQIVTNVFQGYADDNLEGKSLWKSIKMDFEDWTKEYWNAINGKIWSTIKEFCIPRGVWIEESKNQFELLIKLVSAPTCDIDLED